MNNSLTMQDRLLYYSRQLQKKPALLQAAKHCGGTNDLFPDEQLYIHVFAPVLTEYVEWVLNQAERSGIHRLYFLARDAWQMYQAASRLCRERKLDMECRYLRVSRYSLRLAEAHLSGKAMVKRICIGGINVTLAKVLRRAGLDKEECRQAALSLYGTEEAAEQALNQVLSYQEILNLQEPLAENDCFMELAMRHSKEAYPSAIGYLKQEGLLEDVPYALVDSGWVGTLQQSLLTLLRTVKPECRLQGYYFGLYEIPSQSDRDDYIGFYFMPEKGTGRKVRFSNCLFETVFSEDTGMTMGYRQKDDRYLPVIMANVNPNAERLRRYDALLCRFMDAYDGSYKKPSASVCYRLLKALMGHPQPWEVLALGDDEFCDDVIDQERQKVAAVLDREEIRAQHFFQKALRMSGLKKGVIHESAWIEGSIVRNGHHVKSDLFHAAFYKYTVYLRKLWKSKARSNISLRSEN